MSIGTTKLCHVAILVKDIRKATDNWSKILGLPKPNIWTLPPFGEVPTFTDGKPGDYTDCQLAVFELENVKIELVQPGPNSGPWKEKLDRDGEGLQHLSFIVPDRKKAQDTLKETGASAPYHIGYWPGGTYAFVDTAEQCGVEINIKTDVNNTEIIKKLQTNPDLHKADL
jgi:catechol 2,3-dioxygenase-like lactoylglutathione lyase family enzyme